jgi:hypothetical protein
MDKEYYYIARRKPRNQKPKYAGDGVMAAESKKEVWEIINNGYGCLSKKYTIIELREDKTFN